MDYLVNLNPQQQQAVSAGSGPVLVLAGPGSGKTRVLTQRIAYLIGQMDVHPYNILAVTFTNKAAKEMESRVQELVGQNTRGLTLGTFHATCARILRIEAEHLPFQSNYVIFDTDDQLSVVKRALLDLNLDKKRYQPQSVLASISKAKNELLLPDEFVPDNYRDEVVKRIYTRYQEMLLANNGLDFDDLLLWTARLLEEVSQVREKYARRYEYVLVDEFQDTNLAQYRLLHHLASVHRNIFVVGDVDQSIYAWRGADYKNVLRFERDFPETQVILLEQNYRSTQAILDVAMSIIDRNPNRTAKKLVTDRGFGEKITVHETYDDREESNFVVENIARYVANNQSQPGDFAVMYRTNAQSRLLEEAFLQANLPYKLVGAQRFYGRREIKDLIAYLRIALNQNDEISLARVINVPARGIGTKSVIALRTVAQQAGVSPGELLLDLGKGNSANLEAFQNRMGISLSKFGTLFLGWREIKDDITPLQLLDQIIEDTGYRDYIDDGSDEGRDRWENVMELRRLADEFKVDGLDPFLERVALVSDQDTLDSNYNVPTLLTLHAAKGLEFPTVFIVGLSDGTLPHVRSFDDPESMQEERRLFYVGITRAMDRLFLILPLNRSAFGYSEPVDESRFLKDIPDELIKESTRSKRTSRVTRSSALRWEKSESQTTARSEPQYQAGATVMHPVWGEGLVLNSRIQDDDEIVDVFFAGEGLKRLAASLARLEIKN
ncbi:MAG: UvrD-helicase domain-containing protein [Chloroflexota bacterium]|nr:MAG: UvrD-helicase domain-containing protein [Chloroflexota bacterium]